MYENLNLSNCFLLAISRFYSSVQSGCVSGGEDELR